MGNTLLAPVDRERKLITHIDRAAGRASLGSNPVSDTLGAFFANAAFDRATRAPAMVGPGEWKPGLSWRGDGWVNGVTGFGTSIDKTTYSEFRPDNWLSDSACEALFTFDDMTKRGICTIPKELLRKGYGIELGGKVDKGTESKVLDAAEELQVNHFFMRAQWWGGLFGDGAVVIGADDGRPSMLPLIPERVRKIDWLDAYDRRYYAINSYYTDGPKFGQPETYALGNPGMVASPIQVVHETRIIRFGGAPTTTHMRQMRGGYDASKLQDVFEVLRAFATGHKAVEVLLTDGPQGVFKIKNLASIIGSRNKSAFEQRLQMIDQFRSAMRAVVVDSDTEDFQRHNITFSGIPDILNGLALRQAAAWHMPLSKLMGQSAAGLNATGEGDMRNWYDELETEQKNELAPALRKFYKILCATKEGPTSGAVPPSVAFKFVPLYSLNPKEESERRQNVATTDKIYFDIGAATAEEIALSRFTDRGYDPDGITIDRELRQTLVDADKAAALTDNEPSPPKGSLTPSSNEALMTVDEGRATLGLGPDPDPSVGAMKITEYKAKQEAASAPGSHPADPELNKPNGHDVPDPAEVAKQDAEAKAAALGGKGQAPPKGKDQPVKTGFRTDESEDQPRDEAGRFASSGGVGKSSTTMRAQTRHVVARDRLAQTIQSHVSATKEESLYAAAKERQRGFQPAEIKTNHEIVKSIQRSTGKQIPVQKKDVERTRKILDKARHAEATTNHEAAKASGDEKRIARTARVLAVHAKRVARYAK